VKAIYGLDGTTNTKLVDKKVSGLLSTMLGIQGHRGKHSTFQAKVVNKPVDLVGRTTLVPDMTLGLDQGSVPVDVLWKLYAPFVIRNLVKRGVQATKATEYVTNKHPLAEQALHEEMVHRPGVVTRDPQLHRYSAQGLYLKPNSDAKDHTIKLNPLLFKGYGAVPQDPTAQGTAVMPDMEGKGPSGAIDTATQLGQAGQKEMFDAQSIATLAKYVNGPEKVVSYVPSLITALDNIGRTKFLLSWEAEKFKSTFGADDLPEFVENTTNVFSNLGDLILKIRKVNPSISLHSTGEDK